MTTLREAAQQALEALERYQVKRQDFDRFADEITALRAALKQEEEASAWLAERKEYWRKEKEKMNLRAALAQQAEPVDGACLHGVDDGACKECYAANAEAVEQVLLTEEEIEHIGMTHQSLRQVVRAVKQAHEIKE
jgi:hypothetical protein